MSCFCAVSLGGQSLGHATHFSKAGPALPPESCCCWNELNAPRKVRRAASPVKGKRALTLYKTCKQHRNVPPGKPHKSANAHSVILNTRDFECNGGRYFFRLRKVELAWVRPTGVEREERRDHQPSSVCGVACICPTATAARMLKRVEWWLRISAPSKTAAASRRRI